ncbi:MAG TPA: rhodanese-like domain-containing protein, partial [Flavisolibacter sp.]
MWNQIKKLFTGNRQDLQEVLRNGAVIIDVRTPMEYKSGHITGSKNIPVNDIRGKVEMIRKWNKPVITVCRSGSRSMMAATVLNAAGIKTYNGGPWNR